MGKTITETSDIYAFGVIAYELLTGIRPFNVGSNNPVEALQQILRMQQSEAIIPPKQMRPEIPHAAQTLILSALAFDPQRRPKDAGVFAKDLVRSLVGEIVGQAEHPPDQRMTEIAQPTLKAQDTIGSPTQRAQQAFDPDDRSDRMHKTLPRIELSHSNKALRKTLVHFLIGVICLSLFGIFIEVSGLDREASPMIPMIMVFILFFSIFAYPQLYWKNRVKELRERIDKVREEIRIVERSIWKEKLYMWYGKLEELNHRLFDVSGLLSNRPPRRQSIFSTINQCAQICDEIYRETMKVADEFNSGVYFIRE